MVVVTEHEHRESTVQVLAATMRPSCTAAAIKFAYKIPSEI
jgi:hypothetical protein